LSEEVDIRSLSTSYGIFWQPIANVDNTVAFHTEPVVHRQSRVASPHFTNILLPMSGDEMLRQSHKDVV
jgi:hypothetical protein